MVVSPPQLASSPVFFLIGGLAADAATEFYTTEILTVANGEYYWPSVGDGNGQDESCFNVSRALLKLRGDIERTLSHKATQLKEQLSIRITHSIPSFAA